MKSLLKKVFFGFLFIAIAFAGGLLLPDVSIEYMENIDCILFCILVVYAYISLNIIIWHSLELMNSEARLKWIIVANLFVLGVLLGFLGLILKPADGDYKYIWAIPYILAVVAIAVSFIPKDKFTD